MRTFGLIALSVAAQQVAATGWTNAKSFSCPSNTDNHCNSDQQRGFDWSGSAVGKDFRKYGGFDFSGFTYVNSFHTKRDALTPRTFQDKCIKGSVTKDTPAAPKISCGSGKSFSISDIQVSSSKDTDLEFVYGYDNGDVCKHTASCSKSGSTIKNSQCGGATSVTFKLPPHVEHADCDIGIHRVSFDCGPPSSPPSLPSSSSVPFSVPSTPVTYHSASASIPTLSVHYSIPTGNVSINTGSETVPGTGTAPVTTPVTSPPVVSPPVSYPPAPSSPVTSTPASSSSPSSPPVASPPASSPPAPSPPASSPASSSPGASPNSSSPVVSPPVSSATVSSPPVVAPPASSSKAYVPVSSTPEGSSQPITLETTTSPPPSITQPIVTTEIVITTLTTCPVTNTIKSGSTSIVQSSFTVSTILSTVTSTVCTKCIAPPASTPAASTGPTLPTSPAPVQSESSTSPVAENSGPSPPPSTPSIPIPVTSATASVTQGSVPSPIPSLPATTQEVVTTEIVFTTLTTCPVTNTVTSGSTQIIQTSQTVSTVFSTVTSTICTKCVAPPNTQPAPSAPVPVPSSLPNGPAPVPSVPVSQPAGPAPVPSVPVSQPAGPAPAPSVPVSQPAGPAPAPSVPVSQPAGPAPAPSVPVSQPAGPAPAPSVPVSQPAGPAPAPSAPVSPPSGPAPAPSVLPKCMNTWITLTKCKNNADSDCYCKNSDFTKNVQDCVSSWSADSDVIQSALSYLAGICAPHVEANPGIVTNVPSTVTLVPIPVATPPSSAPAGSVVTAGVITPPPAPASIPATIISLVKTVTIPLTYSSGPSAGQPVPSSFTTSTLSTKVTVPQVQFTTQTVEAGATGAPEVNLAASSPAPVQAIPTGVAGPSAGPSTFATGILPTGYKPSAQTSITPFTGGAERIGSGIVGAVIVGAVGVWMGL